MGIPASCRIHDYGVIGDCRAAALVSTLGSLDWLCWPRFDSPAIFAALLDREKGGRWAIAPRDVQQTKREYLPETNILQTTFRCSSGTAVLTDLMPVVDEDVKRRVTTPDHEILREVECTKGEVALAMEFRPRQEYGGKAIRLRDRGALGISGEAEGGALWLRSSAPVKCDRDFASAEIHLRAGQRAQFSLTYAEDAPAVLPPFGHRVREVIAHSERWWRDWSGRSTYDGDYRDAVLRSALALKLMSYAPSGAIVASPTTSLPERVGDTLNWDYRYCWLRDASLTVRSLLGLGYRQEAEAFLTWLLHATRLTQPALDVAYTPFGGRAPRECELGHLSGFCESRPVRVGNAARDQLQLDVYGEVLDAAAQYAHAGGGFDRATQKVLRGLGQYVATHWNQPDEGIWEPRGGRQHHSYSRLLCWTALDRLCRMAKQGTVSGVPHDEFARARDAIAAELHNRAWNAALDSYTGSLGGSDLDASLLLIPYYGFERADASRMRATYATLRRELGAGDALIYRYRREPPEGAFGICSFWEAEYLALGGATLEEARGLFERLLEYRNDLGLLAEEIDPETGEGLGNFPQAFTHVGLISAAIAIRARETGERQLPHREEAAAPPTGKVAA